ncbi:hypothetical protein EG68_12221 [Paragonimus skrjabini miyazakii]|uniref:aspartate transaminase n=1 Tax=Paragonimus skrjabini miyazakii TaxID=59628 RepID=A0A8S9YNY4_9TREM|nr:hypothetical protein EG68_12221 [Paragonimus skrjabini miyazakii]
MESFFGEVREAPPIEVFCLSDAFQLDGDANKVNLTVGAYRSNENKPWVLPCVRSVERSMAATDELNKEYLPITGLESMCTCGLKLVLGENNPLIADKKADSCQALGGTGAVFLALQFLHSSCKCTTAYISRPTWPNHKGIAEFTGLRVKEYRYWDPVHRNVDFDGMLTDIGDAPERAIIILHACAHNPTGMDLSREQWTKVAALIKVCHYDLYLPLRIRACVLCI